MTKIAQPHDEVELSPPRTSTPQGYFLVIAKELGTGRITVRSAARAARVGREEGPAVVKEEGKGQPVKHGPAEHILRRNKSIYPSDGMSIYSISPRHKRCWFEGKASISLLRRGSWVRVPGSSCSSVSFPKIRHEQSDSPGLTCPWTRLQEAEKLKKQRLLSAVYGPSPSSSPAKGGALSRCVELWIADGQAAGWSPCTIASRRDMLGKFRWWLDQEGCPDRLEATTAETIRFFLAYLRSDAGAGRWGSAQPNARRPVRPSTVDTYYRALRAFFNFVVREGLLNQSPLRNVSPPHLPKDLLPPFTPEQAQALVDAAKKSSQAARDLPLVLILLDTGPRVSELCSLNIETGSR